MAHLSISQGVRCTHQRDLTFTGNEPVVPKETSNTLSLEEGLKFLDKGRSQIEICVGKGFKVNQSLTTTADIYECGDHIFKAKVHYSEGGFKTVRVLAENSSELLSILEINKNVHLIPTDQGEKVMQQSFCKSASIEVEI